MTKTKKAPVSTSFLDIQEKNREKQEMIQKRRKLNNEAIIKKLKLNSKK